MAGRIYIVVNPLFPTLFKLGHTLKDSVKERKLDNSSIPEDFNLIREYECDDPVAIENLFHDSYKMYRYFSSKSGRRTEFFSSVCLTEVLRWIDTLKNISGSSIKDVTEEAKEEEEEQLELAQESNPEEYNEEKVIGRKVIKWDADLGLKNGDELVFIHNELKKCIIVNVEKRWVNYEGKAYKLSPLVLKWLKGEPSGYQQTTGVQGLRYVTHNGELLHEH